MQADTLVRRSAGAVALIALAAVVACGGATTSGSPVLDPSSMSATTTDGPIVVTLTLEGQPRNDAASWASVLIQNVGPVDVRWAGGGCGDPGGVYIDLTDTFAGGKADWPGRLGSFKRQALGLAEQPVGAPLNIGYIPEARFGKDLVCTADLRIERLGPGQALAYRAGWDGRFSDDTAPVGKASVVAAFPLIGIEGRVDPNATDATPVKATIETAIVGTRVPRALPPALAIDAALADQQFAAWVAAAPENTWINPHLLLQDGVWGVGLFRMGNAAQMEMFGEVKIDAAGAIVGRRFEP